MVARREGCRRHEMLCKPASHLELVTSNIWVKTLLASILAASSRRSAASTIWDTTLSSSCSRGSASYSAWGSCRAAAWR